jgi:hypothetical protein
MGNQKHLEGEEELKLETGLWEMKPERPSKPKYEVVRSFSHQKREIKPGDGVPSDLSEAAMTHLLRRGVLKAL